MHDLQKKEFDRALAFINSIGCKYKVIDSQGLRYTNIVEDPDEIKKRKVGPYPRGSLTRHIKQYLSSIQVGEVKTIPKSTFDTTRIASCATSYMSTIYGTKSYTSHQTKDAVEIMRIY